MNFQIAPIVISVYTRDSHFRQCIAALQKSPLAKQSELFIYSDAPASAADEEAVSNIRAFAHNIQGFKVIKIIERERNFGGGKNASLGHIEITNHFGRSIFMEDDIIAAPGFLTFMNEALEYYKNDERVINITGYRPPIQLPADYNKDIFCLSRFNGWGCGAYVRTMDAVQKKIDRQEFKAVKDKSVFTKNGIDVLHMVEYEINGKINAGDVRCMYQQALNGKITIYPKHSLVQNIGHDGSGIHCMPSRKFHHEALWDKTEGFKFCSDLKVDERIRKANYEFRS